MIEENDIAFFNAKRIELRVAGDLCNVAGVVNDSRTADHAHTRTQGIAATQDPCIVSCYDVVTGAAIDAIVSVLAAGNIVTANQVIVAVAAVDSIIALLTENDVVAVFSVDEIASASLSILRIDCGKDKWIRQQRRRQRQRLG